MQEVANDREVLTPPRKKARKGEEEMPKGIWKAPTTKFPPTMKVETCQYKSKCRRTESNRSWSSMLQECWNRHHLVLTRAEPRRRLGCWSAKNSTGSSSEEGKQWCWPALTASLRGLHKEGARGHFREHSLELGSHGLGQNGFRHFKVGTWWSAVCLVPAGSNEEIEISFVPRHWPVSAEGTKPPEPGFYVRSVGEGEDSRTLEEAVAWNRLQEGGGRKQEHDQTSGEGVACDTLQQYGRLMYRCQSFTYRKDQERRYVDLVPDVFPSEKVFGFTRDVVRGMLDGPCRWRRIHWVWKGADAKAQSFSQSGFAALNMQRGGRDGNNSAQVDHRRAVFMPSRACRKCAEMVD